MERPLDGRLSAEDELPLLAELRQCHQQLTRRKADIELGRERPRLFKLNDGLDRRLMADSPRTR
ncbi:MAG: hypothetical protein CVU18_05430 [Betaproteobacteria bacterium HGW-Betaproteobacteria-12]|nr:MAG: hypothetical protein CVU18_05430 [Betaproteobacteria bacterium HGW-Betaproteobacteria-12]